MTKKATKMNGIGTLEHSRSLRVKDTLRTGLQVEKYLVEDNFDWLHCQVYGDELIGKGLLKPRGCTSTYELLVQFAPLLRPRQERIWVRRPAIKYCPKIHMYPDDSLCLYYPKDIAPTRVLHLADMLPWISEWLIKYEFWQLYGVWLGEEVKH